MKEQFKSKVFGHQGLLSSKMLRASHGSRKTLIGKEQSPIRTSMQPHNEDTRPGS